MTDYTTRLYVAIGVTYPCATIALILRLISRRLTRLGYGFDDILAVIGFLGTTSFVTDVLVWVVDYGLGRPNEPNPYGLSEAKMQKMAWYLLFMLSETYTFAIAFCKFAILGFYWRIFKYNSIRVPIQVLAGLTIAWFVLRLFMVNLQCIPIQAIWDSSIKNAVCKVKKPTFFFSTGLTHLLIEIGLVILPAIEVAKLHLPFGQKIAVMFLFGFGILTVMASIVVAVTGARFDANSPNLGLALATHITWSVAEVNLAVISTSLPMLRPIFRKTLPGDFLTSNTEGRQSQAVDAESGGFRLPTVSKKKSNSNDRTSSAPEAADTGSGEQSMPLEWDHGASTTKY